MLRWTAFAHHQILCQTHQILILPAARCQAMDTMGTSDASSPLSL